MQDHQERLAARALCDHPAQQQEDHGRAGQRHVGKAKLGPVKAQPVGDEIGEQHHLQAEGHVPAALDQEVGGQFGFHPAMRAPGKQRAGGKFQRGAGAGRAVDAADRGLDLDGAVVLEAVQIDVFLARFGALSPAFRASAVSSRPRF